MIVKIFRILLGAFIIFLSFDICDVSSESITGLQQIKAENVSSKLNSETTEGADAEGSDIVNNAAENCDKGKCKTTKCNCCTGWGIMSGYLIGPDSCKECKCGKQFSCSFTNAGVKKCICGPGYIEVNGICKADCKKNPCKNGGMCSVKGNDVLCTCKQSFTGQFCQTHKCIGIICKNGGKCDIKNGQAVCLCPDEYTGVRCEIDKCSLLQCKEDEICVIENEEVMCKVVEDRSPCESNPCENGGSCIISSDMPEGFYCNCSVQYEGERCEIDKCSLICRENEICVVEDGEITCKIEKSINSCILKKQQVNWETAVKQCANEDSNLLCYKNFKEIDDLAEAFALTATGSEKQNGELAFWLSKRNCSSEEVEKCLSLHIAKSDNTTWHYFQTNCGDAYPYVCCANETDECDVMNCRNGGTCNIIGGKAVCECPEKYTGDRCEKHKCDELFCERGGMCVVQEGRALCLCPIGYTGIRCEIRYNPCDNVTCQNGGRCITDGKDFNCWCKEPFTGKLCESDPCSNEPCMNGGRCFIRGKTFYCSCDGNYAGRYCEVDLCPKNLCKNGGTCTVIQERGRCFCKDPYTGSFCDIRMDNCTTNICKNGGICRITNGERKCFCMEPYQGKYCDTRTDIQNNTSFAVACVLFSSVLLTAVVFCILSCLLCCRMRRKN